MQTDLLQKSEADANQRLFLLSDFQKSTSTLIDFKQEELPTYYYQAKSEMLGNVFIDSVWFDSPVHRLNAPIKVFFRIKNQSASEVTELNINLTIDAKEKGWKSLNIAPNSYIEESINYTNTTSEIKKGKLHIKTNQLFFDDDFFFTYSINENVNILIVSNENTPKNIEQLYQLNSYYNYSTATINSIKQEDFKNKHLIILHNINSIPSGIQDQLNSSLRNGSTVCFIPGENVDFTNWNSFLGQQKLPTFIEQTNLNAELNYFNADDPLFNGVFEEKPSRYKYSTVSSTYTLNISTSHNFVSIFNYNSSEPFLLYTKQKNGRLFLQTSPLAITSTNFQNHALFAATYLRIAETSALTKKISFTIGKPSNYPLYQDLDEKDQIHLINTDLETDLIPSVINTNTSRELIFDQLYDKINSADFYKLENKNSLKDLVAFNYSRDESNIENLSSEDIQTNFSNANWINVKELQLNSNGQIEISSLKAQEYWRILLFLALLFIAIEILLLKFWKS